MTRLEVALYRGRRIVVEYAESPAIEGGLVWRTARPVKLSQADTDLIVTAIWNAIYEARARAKERGGRR